MRLAIMDISAHACPGAAVSGHESRPSLRVDEQFRCRHRLRAEVVVPCIGNAHEALGCRDRAIEPLAERQGTTASLSPCTTSTGVLTLPTRKSDRNWSFIKSRTGTNE